MQTDILLCLIEKSCHLLLGKPNGFFINFYGYGINGLVELVENRFDFQWFEKVS